MEFIKHKGELQCANSKCNEVNDQRVIYYCWHGSKQIYWFVCDKCGEWTKISFGYESNGAFDPNIRLRNDKIRKFDPDSSKEFGKTW